MLEAPAEHAHELGQVCGAVVLLQELKDKTASYSEKAHKVTEGLKDPVLTVTLFIMMNLFWDGHT